MQKAIVILSFFLVWIVSTSFVAQQEKIHWITTDELQAAYAKEPRPIIIDVYTSWCGWCKIMAADTYNNDSVANYINQHYYAVKLDAETRATILWRGKIYNYDSSYKVNMFSLFITNGQVSYPTTVLLAGIDLYPSALPGYMKPVEIEGPLKFIGDGIYRTKNFPDFSKSFTATW
jgi:uncharacterized protein YyaL (SSP411 family)